jgi:hypothetical protein
VSIEKYNKVFTYHPKEKVFRISNDLKGECKMKKLGLILLIAVLVSVLPGCGPMAFTNINGRGSVATNYVYIEDAAGSVPGEIGVATFSLSFACYTQNNNRLQAYVNWYDPANGVRISAKQPEVSVKTFTGGVFTTCKALKAGAASADFYVAVSGIYSEDGNANGDMGTQTGMVVVVVSKPGVSMPAGPFPETIDCGDGTAVMIMEQLTPADYPVYMAGGCLDRGKIVFGGGGQNQQ